MLLVFYLDDYGYKIHFKWTIVNGLYHINIKPNQINKQKQTHLHTFQNEDKQIENEEETICHFFSWTIQNIRIIPSVFDVMK